MPTIFVPHGGGPWPAMPGMVPKAEYDALYGYLQRLPSTIPTPNAIVIVSAHWEARVPTVQTHATPPLYFDYYGFPPETYALTWPAPGAPQLAERVRALVGGAADPERGFDHGTFVPLAVAWPRPQIPTLQLSLVSGLDPATHLELGRKLAPLRDEGVLLVGSGMSFHNMRGFGNAMGHDASETFDAWLRKAAVLPPKERSHALLEWARAPGARAAHPREEHLIPLHVIAGAAENDPGVHDFSGTFAGAKISAFRYG